MKPLRACHKHPYVVRYDGKKCPCCRMIEELGYYDRKKWKVNRETKTRRSRSSAARSGQVS